MDRLRRGPGGRPRAVRHAIVRARARRPGTPVSEAQLVARFGFSKAAIRAALARLRAEGLVLAEPRRGHVIAPLTHARRARDLRPAPAARAARRGGRGRPASPPASSADLRELWEPEPDLDDAASAEHFMQANRAVHVSVADAGGQPPRVGDRGAVARRQRTRAADRAARRRRRPRAASARRAPRRCLPRWRPATAGRPPG